MLGAIAGNIIGSTFEITNLKAPNFFPLLQRGSRFTDDSVLTLATAEVLLHGGNYADVYQHNGRGAFPMPVKEAISTCGSIPATGDPTRVPTISTALSTQSDPPTFLTSVARDRFLKL